MTTPLRDTLKWAIPGTVLAMVLYWSNALWGNTGILIAALLFVVGLVVALTIVALRTARGKERRS